MTTHFYQHLALLQEILLVPKQKYSPSKMHWTFEDNVMAEGEKAMDQLVLLKRNNYNTQKYQRDLKVHQDLLEKTEGQPLENTFVAQENITKTTVKLDITTHQRQLLDEQTDREAIQALITQKAAYVDRAGQFVSQFPEFMDERIPVSHMSLHTQSQYLQDLTKLVLNIINKAQHIYNLKTQQKWKYTEYDGYEEFLVPIRTQIAFGVPIQTQIKYGMPIPFKIKAVEAIQMDQLYESFKASVQKLNVLVHYVENTDKMLNLLLTQNIHSLNPMEFTDKYQQFVKELTDFKWKSYEASMNGPVNWFEYLFGSTGSWDRWSKRMMLYCKYEMDLYFKQNAIDNDYKKNMLQFVNAEGIFDFSQFLFGTEYIVSRSHTKEE